MIGRNLSSLLTDLGRETVKVYAEVSVVDINVVEDVLWIKVVDYSLNKSAMVISANVKVGNSVVLKRIRTVISVVEINESFPVALTFVIENVWVEI